MNEKNMKIGIITYHEPLSYGAHLQCLGLQIYLEEIGCMPEIIDYSNSAYMELRSTNKIKSLVKRTLKILKNPKGFFKAKRNAKNIEKEKEKYRNLLDERNERFKIFEKKYYKLSQKRYEKYSELKNDCPNYDAYICGSDQIWNPSFCDMDDNYFLTFAPENKRIAYAPSFGVSKIPFYARNEYIKRLKGIYKLSIREKTGANIIKKLINKDVPVVIDPTFLVNKEKWLSIAEDSDVILSSEYIITYFIGIDDYINKYIKEVKEKFPNYEVINLIFDKTKYGPCDFIKIISKAKFVFTNSFHGLAFAINLNVPFAVGKTLKDFGSNSGFSRIEDLLESLGLSDRIYFGNNELNEEWLQLDYSKINQKKEQIVEKSKKYLIEALKDIKEKN